MQSYAYFTSKIWRDGGEATQRIANPCTPVRIRFAPPSSKKNIFFLTDGVFEIMLRLIQD